MAANHDRASTAVSPARSDREGTTADAQTVEIPAVTAARDAMFFTALGGGQAPPPADPSQQQRTILSLQRTLGNRAVMRVLARAESGSLRPLLIQREPQVPVADAATWRQGDDGSLHLLTATGPGGEFAALDDLQQRLPSLRQPILARIVGSTLELANHQTHSLTVRGAGTEAQSPADGQVVSDRLGEGVFLLRSGPGSPQGLARLQSAYDVLRVDRTGRQTPTGVQVVAIGLGPIGDGLLVYVAGAVQVPTQQTVQVYARPPDSPALHAERERFIAEFQQRAVEFAMTRLRESENRLMAEQRLYGFYTNDAPQRAGDRPDREGIITAAAQLLPRRRELARLRSEETDLRERMARPGRPRTGGRPQSSQDAEEGALEYEGVREQLQRVAAQRQAAETAFAEFRRPRIEQFPLLAAFDSDDRLDALEEVATGNSMLSSAATQRLLNELMTKRTGIQWLRAELERFPGRVWVLNRIIDQTATAMNLDPRGAQRSWVRAHAQAVREYDEFVRRAVDIIAFVLSAGAIVATAGGAAPAVVAAAAGASAAADTGAALIAGHDTAFQAAAVNTDPDRSRAVMAGEDPSLAWLVIAILGASASAGSAMTATARLAARRRAASQARELAPSFRAAAERRHAGLPSAEAEQTLRAAGNQVRGGLGDELVGHLPPAQTAATPHANGPSYPTGSSPAPIAGPIAGPEARRASFRRQLFATFREYWEALTGVPQPRLGTVLRVEIEAEALRRYEQLIERRPGREAAIWWSIDSGDYAVVQGEGNWIMGAVNSPNSSERWLLIEHFHPERNTFVQLASWADFESLLAPFGGQAAAHAGQIRMLVSSRVRFRHPVTGQYFFTTFGFDPAGLARGRPFFMEHLTASGSPVRHVFANQAEHEQLIRTMWQQAGGSL